jgi:hypothetical protein
MAEVKSIKVNYFGNKTEVFDKAGKSLGWRVTLQQDKFAHITGMFAKPEDADYLKGQRVTYVERESETEDGVPFTGKYFHMTWDQHKEYEEEIAEGSTAVIQVKALTEAHKKLLKEQMKTAKLSAGSVFGD